MTDTTTIITCSRCLAADVAQGETGCAECDERFCVECDVNDTAHPGHHRCVPTDDGDTFERDGFNLSIKFDQDVGLTPEDTMGGVFTSDWSEGCLDREKEGYHVSRDEHPYFKPGMTQAEHEKGGSTPEQAREYVLEDMRRCEAFGTDWCYMVVTVKAERDGVEMGEAILGGIETNASEEYRRQIIGELASEAIAEAQQELAARAADKRHGERTARAWGLVRAASFGKDITEEAAALVSEEDSDVREGVSG